MWKPGPDRKLLESILKASSQEEQKYYLGLFNQLGDEGKSDLLSQMWYGLKDYKVKREGNSLFFEFPCCIGYMVMPAKFTGADKIVGFAVMGPSYSFPTPYLHISRLQGIHGYLETKFGFNRKDCILYPESDATVILIENKSIEIPSIASITL